MKLKWSCMLLGIDLKEALKTSPDGWGFVNSHRLEYFTVTLQRNLLQETIDPSAASQAASGDSRRPARRLCPQPKLRATMQKTKANLM